MTINIPRILLLTDALAVIAYLVGWIFMQWQGIINMTKWHKIERMAGDGNVPVIDYQTSAYMKSKYPDGSCKFYYDVRKDYVVRFAKEIDMPMCNISNPKSVFLRGLCLTFFLIAGYCAVCTLITMLVNDWIAFWCIVLILFYTLDIGALFVVIVRNTCELHKKAKLFNRKIEGMSGREIEELYHGVYDADEVTE